MTSTSTATADTLVVSEVFGPTVQGEGPSLGRRAGFIRLGGCDLGCTWCDAAYTWDAGRFSLRDELERWPVERIVEQALVGDPGLVVITGGEPLLHQDQPAWPVLLRRLLSARVEIEVETNGTRSPSGATRFAVTRFNVSPKLAHAGDPESARINPGVLEAFCRTGKAVFKFVCRDAGDVVEVSDLVHRYAIPPRTVWIMPEGVTRQAINDHLALVPDTAIAAGFNVTTRLHILAWGDERGR